MLVYRANPVEVELFCYVRASSVRINLHLFWPLEENCSVDFSSISEGISQRRNCG